MDNRRVTDVLAKIGAENKVSVKSTFTEHLSLVPINAKTRPRGCGSFARTAALETFGIFQYSSGFLHCCAGKTPRITRRLSMGV